MRTGGADPGGRHDDLAAATDVRERQTHRQHRLPTGPHGLGCTDEFSRQVICGGGAKDFGVAAARETIRSLSLAPWGGAPWNILILEEFECLSPECQTYLKVALDVGNLPRRAIVIATSNDVDKITKALLQRFT